MDPELESLFSQILKDVEALRRENKGWRRRILALENKARNGATESEEVMNARNAIFDENGLLTPFSLFVHESYVTAPSYQPRSYMIRSLIQEGDVFLSYDPTFRIYVACRNSNDEEEATLFDEVLVLVYEARRDTLLRETPKPAFLTRAGPAVSLIAQFKRAKGTCVGAGDVPCFQDYEGAQQHFQNSGVRNAARSVVFGHRAFQGEIKRAEPLVTPGVETQNDVVIHPLEILVLHDREFLVVAPMVLSDLRVLAEKHNSLVWHAGSYQQCEDLLMRPAESTESSATMRTPSLEELGQTVVSLGQAIDDDVERTTPEHRLRLVRETRKLDLADPPEAPLEIPMEGPLVGESPLTEPFRSWADALVSSLEERDVIDQTRLYASMGFPTSWLGNATIVEQRVFSVGDSEPRKPSDRFYEERIGIPFPLSDAQRIRLLEEENAVLKADNEALRAARVTCVPDVCGGAACVRGTRITVKLLRRLMQQGASDAELLESYGESLTREDIEYVRALVRDSLPKTP